MFVNRLNVNTCALVRNKVQSMLLQLITQVTNVINALIP